MFNFEFDNEGIAKDLFKPNYSVDWLVGMNCNETRYCLFKRKTKNLKSIVKKNLKQYHKLGYGDMEKKACHYLHWLTKEYKRQRTNKHNISQKYKHLWMR